MLYGDFPYPPAIAAILKKLLLIGLGSLLLGCAALLTLDVELGIPERLLKPGALTLIFVAFSALGALFLGIAISIFRVNRARQGTSQPYLLPTRYGTARFERPIAYIIFVILFSGLGGMLLALALTMLKILTS